MEAESAKHASEFFCSALAFAIGKKSPITPAWCFRAKFDEADEELGWHALALLVGEVKKRREGRGETEGEKRKRKEGEEDRMEICSVLARCGCPILLIPSSSSRDLFLSSYWVMEALDLFRAFSESCWSSVDLKSLRFDAEWEVWKELDRASNIRPSSLPSPRLSSTPSLPGSSSSPLPPSLVWRWGEERRKAFKQAVRTLSTITQVWQSQIRAQIGCELKRGGKGWDVHLISDESEACRSVLEKVGRQVTDAIQAEREGARRLDCLHHYVAGVVEEKERQEEVERRKNERRSVQGVPSPSPAQYEDISSAVWEVQRLLAQLQASASDQVIREVERAEAEAGVYFAPHSSPRRGDARSWVHVGRRGLQPTPPSFLRIAGGDNEGEAGSDNIDVQLSHILANVEEASKKTASIGRSQLESLAQRIADVDAVQIVNF